MSGKFELKCKSELHNYFEIEVYEEGKLKQTAFAQNVITKQYFDTSYEERWSIAVGRGTGEPSSGDTKLFSEITYREASKKYYVINENDHIYGLEFQITILSEELVGEEIKEIGLKAGYHTQRLFTHAMIKDAEGNPITIHKSATDEIKIKAHMIASLAYPNEHCFSFLKGVNALCCMVLPVHSNNYSLISGIKVVGVSQTTYSNNIGNSYNNLHQNIFSYEELEQTLTKKRRFNTTDVNNIAIHSLIIGDEMVVPLSSLPDWTGFDITGEVLGMGDGEKKEFPINWVEPENVNVFKNNELVDSSDYVVQTIDNYVLYNWKFIEVLLLDGLNSDSYNRLDLRYKEPSQNRFLGWFRRFNELVLFDVTGNDINLLCILEGVTSDYKSFGNMKTIKTLHDNKYYNIVNDKFIPCSESEALSTVEDVALNSSYEFNNGIIKLNKKDGYYVPYKNVVKKKIVFNTAPTVNEEIKANYHVNYIPKDDKHVLDVTFTTVKRAGQGS